MAQPLKYTKNPKDIFQGQEKKKTIFFKDPSEHREEDKNPTVFVP